MEKLHPPEPSSTRPAGLATTPGRASPSCAPSRTGTEVKGIVQGLVEASGHGEVQPGSAVSSARSRLKAASGPGDDSGPFNTEMFPERNRSPNAKGDASRAWSSPAAAAKYNLDRPLAQAGEFNELFDAA